MAYRRIMLVRPRSACGWGYAWAPLAINLEYIASSIQGDVDEIKIVNQEFDDSDIAGHIREFRPDLFGVTMSAVDHDPGLGLCRTASRMGVDTIVGGFHPTAIPGELLGHRQVKMVLRGEGELTMKELVKKGSPVGVEGLSFRKGRKVIHNDRRPLVKDLDTLPFPARHLRVGNECDPWNGHSIPHRDQVHFSRGCWGKCTFCNEPGMSGSKHRYRSPGNVMKELKEMYEYHDREKMMILFGDPHFLGRPKHVDQLCDLLIDADMDMAFTVMIRADMVSRSPDTVKKMVEAGIVGSCMGIESPNQNDLTSTKKGSSNNVHERAVGIMRKNHGTSGGTFVIGLPGQTEEEILTFPEYARHLGLIHAGFGIATPLPGTPFYADMDAKGLIDVRDFSKYDEMHSVFRHDSITRERLEELMIMCMGRFYAPDIALDDMIESQLREHDGRKTTMSRARSYLQEKFSFINSTGRNYSPEQGREYLALFFRSMANPYTRMRLKKIGIHNVMELGPLLRVLGEQKLEIAVSHNGDPLVYLTLKTTRTSIEYVDISESSHGDATLHLQIDTKDVGDKRRRIGLDLLRQLTRNGNLGVALRGALAGFIEYIAVDRSNRSTGPMTIPKEYHENGCRMDGWNPEGF